CQFKLNALNESAWYRSNTHRHLQHQRPSRWLEGRRGKPPKTTPFIAHPKPMLSMLDRKQAGRKRNLFYTPQLLLCFLQSFSLIQPYSKRRDDKQNGSHSPKHPGRNTPDRPSRSENDRANPASDSGCRSRTALI